MGDSAVGKTCLLKRFLLGKYNNEEQTTIAIDYA